VASSWLLDLASGVSWVNLAGGLLILAGPWAMRWTGSVALVAHTLIALGVGMVALLFVGSQGTNLSTLYSLPIIPLFAMLLGGLRMGVLWAGLSCLAAAFLIYAPLPAVESRLDFAVVDTDRQVLRDVVVITVWITMLAGIYERVRSGALRDAQRARRRAEESEERFFRAFAANPDAIVVAGLDGERVIECNEGFAALCGRPRERVVRSLRWTDAFRMDEEQRRAARKTLGAGDGHLELEVAIPSPDGEPRALLVSASRVELDGRACVLATGRDITERKRLEEQLRQAQKMEAVGQLAGSIAHDFNNMLTVISGYAEHLRDSLDGDLREMAAEVRGAAERSASLTRQLLAFSRRQVLNPQILDLAEMLRRLETLLQRLIGEHVVIDLDLPAGPALVRADPGQLEQVVVNLAINARDAMPEGGRLTVAVETVDGGDGAPAVRLRVTDTGTGMDEKTLERAFEPFFTTKEQGKGTGLGLSTVHGIVRQSDGEITIASRPGRGTTVEVLLPRVEGVAAAVQVDDAAGPPGAPGRAVLLVEDDPRVRRLASRSLRGVGYVVLEAEDGEEALRIFGRSGDGIDLVLTDVVMPRKGGAELAAALRDARPDLPVLFMSGYPNPREDQAARLPEGAELIHKPFSPTLLRERVARVLAERPGRLR
jgi:PAS domain S-box-containing protein